MKIINLGGIARSIVEQSIVFSGTAPADQGEVVSETREVEDFREIVSTAAADIEVSFGEQSSMAPPVVVVRGGSKAVSRILTESRRGVLTISSKDSMSFAKVSVEIVMPNSLGKISLKGAGDAVIRNMNQCDFSASLTGAGDLEVSGAAEEAEFLLSGAGDVDADWLLTKGVRIVARGAGDVKAWATRLVYVDASGAGDVTVRGGAYDVTSRNSGAGDVKVR